MQENCSQNARSYNFADQNIHIDFNIPNNHLIQQNVGWFLMRCTPYSVSFRLVCIEKEKIFCFFFYPYTYCTLYKHKLIGNVTKYVCRSIYTSNKKLLLGYFEGKTLEMEIASKGSHVWQH